MWRALAGVWFGVALIGGSLHGQSVSRLQACYDGRLAWDATEGVVTFVSSGTISFPEKVGDGTNLEQNQKQHYWLIPKEVKRVFIGEGVQVTGAFHAQADIRIEGEDRNTSVIYGTPLQRWADVNPGGLPLREWYYSQIENLGGVMHLGNLTLLNPFSYFVRGYGTVIHMKGCDLIDDRGGAQNHSDGFVGGDGSTVEDCYFECGDDVFKAYFDYTVKNCTIKMIRNSVPIQLGWGDKDSVATTRFENLTILGDGGRPNSDNAIISGRQGRYTSNIFIDGCDIENPNAVLVSLWDKGMTLNGEISRASIKVRAFTDRRDAGTNNLVICGSTDRRSDYSCF